MPCYPLDNDTGQVGWVCTGGSDVLRREDGGVRWCFGCRKHLRHTNVLIGERGPSYWEPRWVSLCWGCQEDRTEFPTTW